MTATERLTKTAKAMGFYPLCQVYKEKALGGYVLNLIAQVALLGKNEKDADATLRALAPRINKLGLLNKRARRL